MRGDSALAADGQRANLDTRPLNPDQLPHNLQRHIVLSDYHHRTYLHRDPVSGKTEIRHAHDERALAVVEKFMLHWKPDVIHLAGDWVDFYKISRFCKVPPDEDELFDSVTAVRKIFGRIRQAHPNATMYYELGNHELRWELYVEANAHAARNILDTSYNTLFQARDLGITILPYKERLAILPGLLDVTHGDLVRKGSGMTARGMLEKGTSGVSGHTHRLGTIYKTTRTGTTSWSENGCLCSLSPDYAVNVDWQQGFSLIWVDKDREWYQVQQVPIIKGKIFYEGRFYTAA